MNSTLRFDYRHVDVFAAQPLRGNGLTAFQLTQPVPTALLQRITQEMRQFESIFLWPTEQPQRWRARMFTMEEELGFAGHPVIGAACVLHEQHAPGQATLELELQLPAKQVTVTSRRNGSAYSAEMDQGEAEFVSTIGQAAQGELLGALNLQADDVAPGLPLQVVSTGLPYLIVPLRAGLDRTRIVHPQLESLLAPWGAKFAYAIDVDTLEGRTWDNDGRVEDIATGSAAGPAAAYLARHGRIPIGRRVALHQGRFLGRPSELHVLVSGGASLSVRVSGDVAFVGAGHLLLPASELAG
ncbi:PhzF family phenazine biosynthesis protein [Ideonella sp. BN130291]|uniref:PhzF family phenazine biosynthesis protein n=1 Tax=Ideonella sp. BN130291 TaxID=3112940 RepID=UPI002E26F587|nr:PhzF family phenazine biosynthesis protein [Ideonella sp. BN130291]